MSTKSRESADCADFIAAWASLEAARGHPAGAELQCLAGDLRSLAHQFEAVAEAPSAGDARAAAELSRLRRRIDGARQNQGEIFRLADKITASARRMTRALRYPGRVARVVACSRDRAARLRALVAGLECGHRRLCAALARDRERIASAERRLARAAEAAGERTAAPPRLLPAGPRRY